jgi:hypothetical protein
VRMICSEHPGNGILRNFNQPVLHRPVEIA